MRNHAKETMSDSLLPSLPDIETAVSEVVHGEVTDSRASPIMRKIGGSWHRVLSPICLGGCESEHVTVRFKPVPDHGGLSYQLEQREIKEGRMNV